MIDNMANLLYEALIKEKETKMEELKKAQDTSKNLVILRRLKEIDEQIIMWKTHFTADFRKVQ